MKGSTAGCAPGWRLSVAALGAVVGAVSLSLSGCSSSDATPPARTVAEESTTSTSTSTTTVEQSYAVPEVIDIAYVNRVLAALEHVAGDVVRKIHATGQFAQEDLIPLRAIYNDPEFEIQAKGFAGLVTADPQSVKDPPGDNTVVVSELLAAETGCIHVRAQIDASKTLVDPPPPRTAYLELRPKQPGADPHALNPTPWAIQHESAREESRCEPA